MNGPVFTSRRHAILPATTAGGLLAAAILLLAPGLAAAQGAGATADARRESLRGLARAATADYALAGLGKGAAAAQPALEKLAASDDDVVADVAKQALAAITGAGAAATR